MIIEILYLVPILCLMTLLLRSYLSKISLRTVISSEAFRRLCALTIGFISVLVPSRIAIAMAPPVPIGDYPLRATTIDLSGLSTETVANRILTGLPPAGWSYRGEFFASLSPTTYITNFLSNEFITLNILALITLAILASRRAIHEIPDSTQTLHSHLLNSGIVMLVAGGVITVLSALLVGATVVIQTRSYVTVGYPWRETLLVQIGWALILTSAVHFLVYVAESRYGGRSAHIALVLPMVVFLCGTFITYWVNNEYAHQTRGSYTTTVDNLLSQSIVDFGTDRAAADLRCTLASDYLRRPYGGGLGDSTNLAIMVDLNQLADTLYGQPFCQDDSFQIGHGLFVDDDDSPYELELETFAKLGITGGCSIRSSVQFICPNQRMRGGHLLVYLGKMSAFGSD